MIGLMFLGVFALWVWLAIYLGLKIPKWFGWKWKNAISVLLIALFFAAPFVDEVVGMRQFKQLCKERDVVHLSPDAAQVKRAKSGDFPTVELPGYWITIRSQPVVYVDIDTGKQFMRYEMLHTRGGYFAGALLMGGMHTCRPRETEEINRRLNINKLFDEGRKL
jgi:energy-coupling factor transporter transmembrane protein EcfT